MYLLQLALYDSLPSLLPIIYNLHKFPERCKPILDK